MNLHDLFAIPLGRDPGRVAIEYRVEAGALTDASASAGALIETVAPAGAMIGTVMPAGATGTFTYGDLFGAADTLAAGLAARGVEKGDRVAVQLGNRPELVVAWLALLRLGAILVPVNPAYKRREVAHILGDCEPRLLLVETAEAVDEVRSWIAKEPSRGKGESAKASGDIPAVSGTPGNPRVSEAQTRPGTPEALETLEIVAAGDLARWAAEAAEPGASPDSPRFPRVDGSDPAAILYTSGTTGASKGAVLTHDNLLSTITGLLAAWGWRQEDVLYLALPLIHVHGLIVGLACALAAGASVLMERRFDAARAVDELAAGRASLFFGVPTMYVRLVDELRRRERPPDLSGMRLFCAGSAPLAPETFAAFRDLTGHDVLERYGMTEAGMILSNPYVGRRLPGTVGTPLPGVSVRIAGADGAGEVAPGEVGQVLVRGANVFAGYWRDSAKTAASFRQDESGRRWLATGDLARRDPETGYVSLLGRRHELILCGGYNVYPREIEEVLTTYPGVREAAVTGRPDPEWGEVPVAYLVLDGGDATGVAGAVAAASAPDDALAAFCRERLAGFKVPRAFHRVEALPRNALGKLQKHLLPR